MATLANGLPGGIGDPGQASTVTAFIRQQPWYMDWLAKNQLTPGPDQQVKLSKQQRQDLAGLAVQHGIGLNHKFDQFDENGQVSEAHHKLKKTLIAAAIGGAALTGLGAAGIGPLAGAFAGGTTAATGGTAALTGTAAPLASTTIGTGMMAPIVGGTGLAGGTAAGTAAATGGVGAALTTGKKIADLAMNTGKALSGSGEGEDGNAANAPQAAAVANRGQALTNNRFLQTGYDQSGVNTDAQVMRNQMRAELASRMNPNGQVLSLQGGKYGLPNLNPTQQGIDFQKTYADKLRERQLAGKSMTLSGVPDPSKEELDATNASNDATGTGHGINSTITGIGNKIEQGSRYAKIGKGIWDGIKGIF